VGTVVIALSIAVFAVAGPLRPGWSRRAGTSAALLAQLARKSAGTAAVPAGTAAGAATPSAPTTPTTPPATGSGSAGVPTAPFTVPLTGQQSTTSPNGQGEVQVTLAMKLQDAASTPLTVVLIGTAVAGGGVSLSSGSVTFGPYRGAVTGLNGGTVSATVSTPNRLLLTLALNVDQSSGALSGTVSGTPGGGSDR
jgi:hypothetical protein